MKRTNFGAPYSHSLNFVQTYYPLSWVRLILKLLCTKMKLIQYHQDLCPILVAKVPGGLHGRAV